MIIIAVDIFYSTNTYTFAGITIGINIYNTEGITNSYQNVGLKIDDYAY